MGALSAVSGAAGSWVARMAELEAAAVIAFTHTANELQAHGLAGASATALTAAEDEVRHAHAVTRLALQLGHSPVVRAVEPGEVRSLEAIAIDNAGEGCGRELFGSILNAHQASSATHAGVRAVMAGLAADEAAHARFSLELARQLMPRLPLAARRRAREAQAQVLEQLAQDELAPTLRATLGLMDSAALRKAAQQLLDSARV
jgi:rubrerythrin